MPRLHILLVSLALVTGGAVSAPTGAAAAVGVMCGARITTYTAPDDDLLDCPNIGLVIAADNITLDLLRQSGVLRLEVTRGSKPPAILVSAPMAKLSRV